VLQGAVIQVGQTLRLSAQLDVGAVSTEVTVQAEPPVVETQRTQQASTIEKQRIQNLPINRRNYLVSVAKQIRHYLSMSWPILRRWGWRLSLR